MSDAQPLPPRPDLAQYRALAKDLKQAAASGDPAAIRRWARRWLDALARVLGPDHQTTPDEREREADRIASRWKKARAKHDADTPCRLADAQFVVAREHGFASWPKFVAHVEALGDGATAVAAFEAAVDAIVRGDVARLAALLRDHPGLVHQRSTRDHRSTLLHYVSANGVEDFRQHTPANIVQIANLLLDAGADVDAESEAYGGGSTTLGLAATSMHPQLAGVQIPLLEILIGRGARIEQPGLAGNQHSAVWGCLANGQPEAAAFFADHGAVLSFEEAAGLGRVDALASFLDANGAIAPSVMTEQRSSALRYGAGYGHVEVVRLLLEKGVEVTAADSDGQTALHWATFGPHLAVARLLLDHGAPVHAIDATHHATPLVWALFAWAKASEPQEREAGYRMAALLVLAGATLEWAALEPRAVALVRSDNRMRAIVGDARL